MNIRPCTMTVRATLAVVLVVLLGTLPAAGQDGSSPAPLPSCGAADAASPCDSPAPGTFSGTMTWTEVADDPGGLGSGENWTATVDLLMRPDADGGLVASGGSYAYTDEFTGHCAGTGTGAGIISTELYAPAEVGVGAASASTRAGGSGDLVFAITLQPEEFLTDCAASPGFEAFQAPAGYSPRRPYCTGVYLAYDAGPPVTYTFSCLEQDIAGLHVTVEGVLTQSPSD